MARKVCSPAPYDWVNSAPAQTAGIVGILAGCVTALLLMIMMVRFPLLLIAVLLACWVFSRLQDIVGKRIG